MPFGTCRWCNRTVWRHLKMQTTLLLGRLSPLSVLTSIVYILSSETANCPSWTSGRETMTIENISWSISMNECCWPSGGQTHNLLITSQTRLQLSHRGLLIFMVSNIQYTLSLKCRKYFPGAFLIVLGFNDTSTLEGHFVSSPREREKRDRRESRGDEREGQGRKRNRKESEETEEIKTFPLYPYPLQG